MVKEEQSLYLRLVRVTLWVPTIVIILVLCSIVLHQARYVG